MKVQPWEYRCSLERNLVPGCSTRSLVGKQVPVEFLTTDIDRGRVCLSRDHLCPSGGKSRQYGPVDLGLAGLTDQYSLIYRTAIRVCFEDDQGRRSQHRREAHLLVASCSIPSKAAPESQWTDGRAAVSGFCMVSRRNPNTSHVSYNVTSNDLDVQHYERKTTSAKHSLD